MILIVGSGLYGSVCARQLADKGYKVKVIEKREHIGGNIFTDNIHGIHVHKYGPHIFHTNDKGIWDYVNKHCEFEHFTYSPLAMTRLGYVQLPFNMHTFSKIFASDSIDVVKEKIRQEVVDSGIIKPKNLEETAISLVGHTIYDLLIKDYTQTQWGRDPRDLPSFIIKRIPLRFTWDSNYFNDKYQGMPINGYTDLIKSLLKNIDVETSVDFFDLDLMDYNQIIYTGPIDRYFNFKYGKLEYRSLNFHHELFNVSDFQGIYVVNNSTGAGGYTRTIEHKHFCRSSQKIKDFTVVTKEFPVEFNDQMEPYYPINDTKNMEIYEKYRAESQEIASVHFGGRLAEYKYYDMHQIVGSALKYCEKY